MSFSVKYMTKILRQMANYIKRFISDCAITESVHKFRFQVYKRHKVYMLTEVNYSLDMIYICWLPVFCEYILCSIISINGLEFGHHNRFNAEWIIGCVSVSIYIAIKALSSMIYYASP